MVPLMGGLDYRASPDWASKLGISPAGLHEAGVGLVSAMTFGSVAEAVGVSRAAARVGLRCRCRSWSSARDGSAAT